MKSEIADTLTGRRGDCGVKLNAVGALFLQVGEHLCEARLLGFAALVNDLADEVERVFCRCDRQFGDALAVLVGGDESRQNLFLFSCQCHIYKYKCQKVYESKSLTKI